MILTCVRLFDQTCWSLTRPSSKDQCIQICSARCEGWDSTTRETVTSPCHQRWYADQRLRSAQWRDARHRKPTRSFNSFASFILYAADCAHPKEKFSTFLRLPCVSKTISNLYYKKFSCVRNAPFYLMSNIILSIFVLSFVLVYELLVLFIHDV